MHYPYTLKNNIYHSNRRNLFKQTETTTIFSFGYRSCAWPRSGLFSWQKPCSGCNSGIDLVVALEHTFFQPCWNTKQISRFTKFRKTTLRICKPSSVVLIKVMLHFCLISSVQNDQVPVFCTCLSSMIVHLHNLFLLSTPVTRMLLAPRWVSGRQDVKWLSINISKLKVGVTHSMSHRTSFSPYPYLIEETCFLSLHLDMIWTDLHNLCLSNKDPDFILLLNRLVVYLLTLIMSFITGHHSIDLFYLFK